MGSHDDSFRFELADRAESAARAAADRLASIHVDSIRVAATKSSRTDMVTEADHATEAQLIATLTAERPDDAILAEESGRRVGTSGVTWIIDPIDGTTNFVYGLAGFNVSVAAMIDDVVVAGVVVDPIRGETFRATRGDGATCNGTLLHGSSTAELADALVGTGFSYIPERREAQARVVAELIGEVRDIRRIGAAALDLCSTAAGRLDGYFESGLKPWDLAAGGLIAAEAGCAVTGLDAAEPDGRLVVAAPPAIHRELRAALRQIAAGGLDVEAASARSGPEFGRLEP
ncbi:MAG: inositol monophosphatase [Actinobacteria bacterium]|nr:inositol monophosphatase [Actinomycetota bacterium]